MDRRRKFNTFWPRCFVGGWEKTMEIRQNYDQKFFLLFSRNKKRTNVRVLKVDCASQFGFEVQAVLDDEKKEKIDIK